MSAKPEWTQDEVLAVLIAGVGLMITTIKSQHQIVEQLAKLHPENETFRKLAANSEQIEALAEQMQSLMAGKPHRQIKVRFCCLLARPFPRF